MEQFKKLFQATDMTVGTPWKKIVAFTIPMLLGNIAQQLYNTVDSIVVGKYVGDNALAAVGSAGPIMNLLLVLFIGIGYWNDWLNGMYYLTERGGGQYYTIQIVLNNINENINALRQSASATGNMNIQMPSTTVRMAIATVGILPILLIYPFFQKYFVKGITLGGVKE